MTRKSSNVYFILAIFFVLQTSVGLPQNYLVYFKSNDFQLDQHARRLIDSLSNIKNIQKISLQGHCDVIGNDGFNDTLSSKRVHAVKERFVSKGIAGNKIDTKAMGKRFFVNKNANETERALNRRVEIELAFMAMPDTAKAPKILVLETDETEIEITGVILNEKNKPLIAEVSLSDKNGNEVQNTTSSPDGNYNFKAVVKKRDDYNLTFYNDSSFISSKAINPSSQKKPYKNLKTILPQLREGKRYKLENLNFEGDTSQLVNASLASLEALYKLMKKNMSLVIQIEGHVNYPSHLPNPNRPANRRHYVPPGMTGLEFNQWLSDERAKVVLNYLTGKGIKPKRMTTQGFGATKMLYPDAISENEQAQNRRVEINVISYKRNPVE